MYHGTILFIPLSILLHVEAWSIGVQSEFFLGFLLFFYNGIEFHIMEQTDLSLGDLVLVALVLHSKSSMAEPSLRGELQRLLLTTSQIAQAGLFLVVS